MYNYSLYPPDSGCYCYFFDTLSQALTRQYLRCDFVCKIKKVHPPGELSFFLDHDRITFVILSARRAVDKSVHSFHSLPTFFASTNSSELDLFPQKKRLPLANAFIIVTTTGFKPVTS